MPSTPGSPFSPAGPGGPCMPPSPGREHFVLMFVKLHRHLLGKGVLMVCESYSLQPFAHRKIMVDLCVVCF